MGSHVHLLVADMATPVKLPQWDKEVSYNNY